MQAATRARSVVGTDIGGTFTDCFFFDREGRGFFVKAPSTLYDLTEGTLGAVEELARLRGERLEEIMSGAGLFTHGSTVAINTLLTRSGTTVGVITTKGFEDTLLIGRIAQKVAGLSPTQIQNVAYLRKPDPIVPRRMVRGVTERIDHRGRVVVVLNEHEVRRAVTELVRAGAGSIAVCFLWSFLNPDHERRVQRLIHEKHPGVTVTVSSDLVPLIKEYERMATTAVNAYLKPSVAGYTVDLDEKLRIRGFTGPSLMMQSVGGLLPMKEAGKYAVNLLSSGPVGGVIASRNVGAQLGYANIIATDAGGTSFDVGLIIGGTEERAFSAIHDQWEILVPSVEIQSIGAGGGSIATVDAKTGELRVGPQSAGADPGPACYGKGGQGPTVTDADVVLGRINPERFLGGRIRLVLEKARLVIKEQIADPLGMTVPDAAQGIVDIADAKMADLIRKMTIERGHDPREFVLFAYGGSGPTHVGGYGMELDIPEAVIPYYAPVFSAYGIATSDMTHTAMLSEPTLFPPEKGRMIGIFDDLRSELLEFFDRHGFHGEAVTLQNLVDMRFKRQTKEITLAVPDSVDRLDMEEWKDRFMVAYEAKYGRGTALRAADVEVVNFRAVGSAVIETPPLRELEIGGNDPSMAFREKRPGFWEGREVATPTYEQSRLRPGNLIEGPALIEAEFTTIPVHPDQRVRVDATLNLRMSRKG